MIMERPFFGHGINTYMRIFQEYSREAKWSPTYAHNCFLQLIAETGILGLMSFLYIFVELFRNVLRQIEDQKIQGELRLILIGLLSGMVAFLIQSFFDTTLYSLQLSIYFWYMVGILMTANSQAAIGLPFTSPYSDVNDLLIGGKHV